NGDEGDFSLAGELAGELGAEVLGMKIVGDAFDLGVEEAEEIVDGLAEMFVSERVGEFAEVLTDDDVRAADQGDGVFELAADSEAGGVVVEVSRDGPCGGDVAAGTADGHGGGVVAIDEDALVDGAFDGT